MKLGNSIRFILIFFVIAALAACGGVREQENVPADSVVTSEPAGPETNYVTLKRSLRTSRTPMGEDKSWSVFVYLCGSDLESDAGAGTTDMKEMERSQAGGNVRFIVQTGGAYRWQSGVSAKNLERYVIADGKTTKVGSEEKGSMGDASTLTSFLRWGVENYPASNMALIFWNHGSGSIGGVCFDEQFGQDGLLLKEIEAALFNVRETMTDSFRFIGFDACLMSTIEAASVLMAHADYMIASQETEDDSGWDYKAMGDYLAAHPDADMPEIAKDVCDSYIKACTSPLDIRLATISCIDLTRIAPLLEKFDAYAQDIYSMTDSVEEYTKISRKITSGDNFGGNNRLEGYTNMVDLGSLIRAGEGYSEHVAEAESALTYAVCYKRNGRDHPDACGLSVYYPLEVQGSSELSIFRDICVSTAYMGLVDKIAYGYAYGSVSDYSGDEYEDMGLIDWFMSSLFYDSDSGDYYYDNSETPNATDWDFLDDAIDVGMSAAISFDEEPGFDEDGYYGFVLSEEGLNNTSSVEAYVLQVSDETEELIDLGITADLYMDFETGEFSDNFDGYWFCLPDGQELEVYIVEECEGYDIYTSPIELNGRETYLRFTYDYRTDEVTWQGVWDGISEEGVAARERLELKEGDSIVPLYYCYTYDFEESDTYYYGDSYIYSEKDEMGFTILPDGEYLYGFYINDIFGDYYTTEYVTLTIEDGEVYYED